MLGKTWGRYLSAAALAWLLSMSAAVAEKRVALVIGNGGYQNTPRLLNPSNDAEDVAGALRRVGFTVKLERELGKRGMEAALQQFARDADGADAAMFFYAGHGIQHNGTNYLMPIDARLEDSVSINFELIRIEDVIYSLQQARGVKLLILDACRNNPLLERLAGKIPDRGVAESRGLARIDPARGMVIAYSTQANKTATDGVGRNSPFSSALVKYIGEPGLEVGTLFRRVAIEVDRVTAGRQVPELSISLLGEFYLNSAETDLQAWTRIRETDKAAEFDDFIRRYPASVLATDARRRLIELERDRQNAALREQSEQGKAQLSQRERLEPEKDGPTVAAIAPAAEPVQPPQNSAGKLFTRDIKKELKRVGCYAGAVDDNWSDGATKTAVAKFVRLAKLPAPPENPGPDFLDVIRRATSRVCPLECGVRQVERGDKCVAKSCPRGFVLDEDGDCEDRRGGRKTATRAPASAAAPGRPTETGASGRRLPLELYISTPGLPTSTPGQSIHCGRAGCTKLQ